MLGLLGSEGREMCTEIMNDSVPSVSLQDPTVEKLVTDRDSPLSLQLSESGRLLPLDWDAGTKR